MQDEIIVALQKIAASDPRGEWTKEKKIKKSDVELPKESKVVSFFKNLFTPKKQEPQQKVINKATAPSKTSASLTAGNLGYNKLTNSQKKEFNYKSELRNLKNQLNDGDISRAEYANKIRSLETQHSNYLKEQNKILKEQKIERKQKALKSPEYRASHTNNAKNLTALTAGAGAKPLTKGQELKAKANEITPIKFNYITGDKNKVKKALNKIKEKDKIDRVKSRNKEYWKQYENYWKKKTVSGTSNKNLATGLSVGNLTGKKPNIDKINKVNRIAANKDYKEKFKAKKPAGTSNSNIAAAFTAGTGTTSTKPHAKIKKEMQIQGLKNRIKEIPSKLKEIGKTTINKTKETSQKAINYAKEHPKETAAAGAGAAGLAALGTASAIASKRRKAREAARLAQLAKKKKMIRRGGIAGAALAGGAALTSYILKKRKNNERKKEEAKNNA